MDNVIISGVGSNVPKWALDVTMKEIGKDIKKMAKLLEAKTKATSPDNVKKASAALDKYIDSLKLSNEAEMKKLKDLKDSFTGKKKNETDDDIIRKKTIKGKKDESTVVEQTTKKTGLFGSSLDKSAGIMSSIMSPGGLLLGSILGISYEFHKLTSSIGEYIDTYMNLNASGIQFSQGMFEFRKAAGDAALPLDEFTKLLQDNSNVVVGFGADGVDAMASLSKQTRMLVNNQMNLGMGYKDVNQYLTSYLQTSRLQGVYDKLSTEQLSEGAARYMNQLTLLSQATGRSRQQIDEETQKVARSPDLFGYFSKLGPEQAKKAFDRFQTSAAAFSAGFGASAGEFNNTFKTMVTSINPYQTELSQGLVGFGFTDLMKKTELLAKSFENPKVSQEQLNTETSDLLINFKHLNLQSASFQAAIQNEDSVYHKQAQQLSSFVMQLQGFNDDDLKGIRSGKAKAADLTLQNIVKLGEWWRQTEGAITGAIANFFIQSKSTFDGILTNIQEFAHIFSEKLRNLLVYVGEIFSPNPNIRKDALEKIKKMYDTEIVPFLKESFGQVMNYVGTSIAGNIINTDWTQFIGNALEDGLSKVDWGSIIWHIVKTLNPVNLAFKVGEKLPEAAAKAGIKAGNFIDEALHGKDDMNMIYDNLRKKGTGNLNAYSSNAQISTPNATPIPVIVSPQYNKPATIVSSDLNTNSNSQPNMELEAKKSLDATNELMKQIKDIFTGTNDKLDTIVTNTGKTAANVKTVNSSVKNNSNNIGR